MNDPHPCRSSPGWPLLFAGTAAFALLRAATLGRRLAVAEERARQSEQSAAHNGELLKAQAALSAQAVTEQLVARASPDLQVAGGTGPGANVEPFQPVAQTLAKFELQVAAIEKARAEETGGLKQQIEQLLKASAATQDEARKLSTALRRGAGVQGRWGEQTLRNVLEQPGCSIASISTNRPRPTPRRAADVPM